MKLLIDTNVILDMVFERKGFDTVINLFQKIVDSKSIAFITASSVTDLFYIIRKETHDVDKTYYIMKNIFKLVYILSVTDEDILCAFQKKWRDFEDCVQYTTAKNNRIDYFVTSNRKDFTDTSLPVLSSTKCIEVLK